MTNLLNPSIWVSAYGDALFNYAKARGVDVPSAEDMVQETFLNAWKARDGFKGESSEKTWLFAILKNKIVDYYRKKATSFVSTTPDQDIADYFFEGKGHWKKENQPSSWSTYIKDIPREKDFQKIFISCISKLHPQQKAVFVLKHLENLPTKEICRLLKITPENYWILMYRAKLTLRDFFEKNWIKK